MASRRRMPLGNEFLELRIWAFRQHHLERHVFVTAITVRPGNALSLEPKHGAGVGPFRYAHGHLARGRRYLHLAAQHGFPERNRQLQMNVVALACEDAVRTTPDLAQDPAGRTA